MKKQNFSLSIASLLVLVGLSNEAYAFPMFEKQTGLDCKACHLQHMPKLTSIGRKFATSGMTQSLKSGDVNGSSMDLNPSVMVKALYEETWNKPGKGGTVSTDTLTYGGDWSVPRTASLFVGGKISDNVGGLLDITYKEIEDNSIGGRVTYAKELNDGYIGAVAYSTASFGPFSGMENYNTGLYKPLRTFDIKKLSNAFQATSIGGGAATGAQVYYDSDITNHGHLFATVGTYTPAQDNVDMPMADNFMPFGRLAYEYRVGDINLIVGGFALAGGYKVASTQPLSIQRETYGVDFQLEGMIADKSVSLVMSKVLQNRVTFTGIGAGLEDDYEDLDNKAFSAEAEVNIFSNFGLKAAYMSYDDLYKYDESSHVDVQDINRAYTVGADYSFKVYLPMKLAVEYAWAYPALERVKDYQDVLVSLNILY